jgi:hypothetical protein
MDLRVMSPSGFQDDRRSSVAFLTTLPRCGRPDAARLFSPIAGSRPAHEASEGPELSEARTGAEDLVGLAVG